MHWAGELLTGLSQMAAGAFVAGLWQGLALAAAAWACLRMLPRASATIRFAVWIAVFTVLAVLPFLHAYTGRTGAALTANSAMFRLNVRWTFVIAGIWLTLSLVRAARLLASGLRLHQIWKRAVPVAASSIAQSAGLHGATLCVSNDVDRPSVIGFFSPRILIPESLIERLSTQELEQIVLHEMGHLRRRDDWSNLVQKIALVLFPLNPALVWIERRLCFERELACDDDVLRQTRAPKAYARCLTNLAEQRMERQSAALTLGAWERRSELGRRVHSILRGCEGMGRIQARVVLGMLLLALVGGATELARCPRIVSFASVSPATQASATISPAEYHQVALTEQNAPHETLLRATSPATVLPAVHRQRKHASSGAVLQRIKKVQPKPQLVQQWVVMTSWSASGATGTSGVSRMVFTVPDNRGAGPSYAAVPTVDGWLLLQL